jgi:hypothetical protein
MQNKSIGKFLGTEILSVKKIGMDEILVRIEEFARQKP